MAVYLTISKTWPVFLWKTNIFPTPCPFNPEFENALFALDGWNFACPSSTHMANYLCKKFSLKTQNLDTIHPLQMNRQTNRQWQPHQ